MLRSPPSLIRPIRPLPCRVRAFNIAINRVAPPMISSSQAIALTPDEDRLCTLLDEFKAFVSKTDPDGKQVECRIAGGWVRDKLLSLPCHDIDLALSNHTGHPFAIAFSAFLEEHHPSIKGGTIAKIASNPEQSKHLETATQKLMGLDLDFVNLRKEGYSDGSRIPDRMEFGTPLEDALRRDITINSLFFNVHTRQVEDWTEKGLADLESGLIRTPLPPAATFDDDPLRVIRCVRFASRLGFKLHEDIIEAIRTPDVARSLRERISRERVGIEVEKMFTSSNALLSVQLITSLNIYPSVFFLPPAFAPVAQFAPNELLALSSATVLSTLLAASASSLPPLHAGLLKQITALDRKRLFLAASCAPYAGIDVLVKKKPVSAAELLVREGLKLSGADALFTSRAFQASHSLSRPSLDKFPEPSRRSAIGNLLRLPEIHQPPHTKWSSSVLWCLVQDLAPFNDAESGSFEDGAREIVESYNLFVSTIFDLDLPTAIEAKHIIDGKEVLALLSLRGGPVLKTLLEHVFTWQLGHPSGSQEQCRAWLQAEWSAGRIVEPAVPGAGAKEGDGKGKKKAKNA